MVMPYAACVWRHVRNRCVHSGLVWFYRGRGGSVRMLTVFIVARYIVYAVVLFMVELRHE